MARTLQHQHSPYDRRNGAHAHGDESTLADLLDLDAEVSGSYLQDVVGWIEQHASDAPRIVADIGAGTGVGSLALARHFGRAEVVAIDASTVMLERLRVTAQEHGLASRLHAVQADLDVAWPDVGPIDLAWAASSLHHLADPDRVLHDVHDALNLGGMLVVIEMDSLPGLLPDDIGLGRPGLEARCHELMAQASWNAHPDWRPHLERAGFEIVEQRTFTTLENSSGATTERYARTFLSRMRAALDDQLADDDRGALDHLLADDAPDALLRSELTVRSSRTAWAARRGQEGP